MSGTISADALGRLRAAKAAMQKDGDIREILESRDSVVDRYGPQFQPGQIEQIDEKVLRSFLLIENNKHWSGLFRQSNRICADMTATRAALAALVDESRPIEERTRPATEIKGLGKGIITAILLVAYPNKYGVWNNTSESGLIDLDLMPDWPRGASFGVRYAAINGVLNELARELEVDLWTLDTIWWYLSGDKEETEVDSETPLTADSPTGQVAARFAIERHLHDYLFDNWSQLELSRDWDIYVRDGEPDAGYEFPTPIGRIDLLAKHKHESKWLVIELKRDKSSDAVVGQILRYIGWISAHLAQPSETVEGLVIAARGEDKLHYALSAVPSVSFKSYEVEFRLKDGPSFDEFSRP
ncbi:endonuclease NucS domain-containing protein [Novosphingobium sp.]|uniref:endonuclease NucS domain-containing protein n=1 Tax=Novosphingobium sp. TaxID=1874826 RepID=UPI0026335940|nr:endonuclease NucS domain-containing protein [Novosphingobium sp.]